MTDATMEMTVGEMVAQRPARARVFEKLGIDYCCGGKKPLGQACSDKGLDVEQVLSELADADRQSQPDQTDWTTASLTDLTRHIETTHHAYLKQELPRFDFITEKVARVHGPNHPELLRVREVFKGFKAELDSHMMKEEMILFPLCRRFETEPHAGSSHCGSVQNPIRVMVMEHDSAGHAMDEFRTLTDGYMPPPDACNTYRAMLDGLREVELDMHQHVHKENNILFPRAVELERRQQMAS